MPECRTFGLDYKSIRKYQAYWENWCKEKGLGYNKTLKIMHRRMKHIRVYL